MVCAKETRGIVRLNCQHRSEFARNFKINFSICQCHTTQLFEMLRSIYRVCHVRTMYVNTYILVEKSSRFGRTARLEHVAHFIPCLHGAVCSLELTRRLLASQTSQNLSTFQLAARPFLRGISQCTSLISAVARETLYLKALSLSEVRISMRLPTYIYAIILLQ